MHAIFTMFGEGECCCYSPARTKDRIRDVWDQYLNHPLLKLDSFAPADTQEDAP